MIESDLFSLQALYPQFSFRLSLFLLLLGKGICRTIEGLPLLPISYQIIRTQTLFEL